jgi:uncharacterized membrane protein YeaQ/YmgE (transglycosylase-associated protein family)
VPPIDVIAMSSPIVTFTAFILWTSVKYVRSGTFFFPASTELEGWLLSFLAGLCVSLLGILVVRGVLEIGKQLLNHNPIMYAFAGAMVFVSITVFVARRMRRKERFVERLRGEEG